MKRVWITDSGIIHHRKPRMDATEYVGAHQQPDAELISALIASLKGANIELNRRNRYDVHAETTRVITNVSYTLKRAEQKGGK